MCNIQSFACLLNIMCTVYQLWCFLDIRKFDTSMYWLKNDVIIVSFGSPQRVTDNEILGNEGTNQVIWTFCPNVNIVLRSSVLIWVPSTELTKLGGFVKYSAKVRSGNEVTITAPMHCGGNIIASYPLLSGNLVTQQGTAWWYLPLNWTTTAGSRQMKTQNIRSPRVKDTFRYTAYCTVWWRWNSHKIYKPITAPS